MEAIRSLILSTSVFDAFKKHPRLASFQEEFWRHSLSVGSACRVLMRKISNEWIKDADRVFSAGLLHDIGKLVMICYLPKEWDRLEAAMKADARPVYIVEKELFDYTHAEIGSALAGRWNLPHTLRNAIALHHSPGEIPDQDALSRLVYCGNLLSHRVFDLDDPAAVPLDRDSEGMISRLGLKPDGFDQLKSLVIEEYAKSEVFLEISRGL